MTEKMIAAPIRLGTWMGEAYQFEGRWYVKPMVLIEHLGLDLSGQHALIMRRYRKHTVNLMLRNRRGFVQSLMCLDVGCAVLWLAGVGKYRQMSTDTQRRVAAMQASLMVQIGALLPMMFAGDASAVPALRGKRRAPLPARHQPAATPSLDHSAECQAIEAEAERTGRTPGFIRSVAAFFKGGQQ